MVAASAPGKLILFGEHAVVFGEPALSVAIDLRTRVDAASAQTATVNGRPLTRQEFPYLEAGIRHHGFPDPLSITISSSIPKAAGMGSSAALTVSLLACLQALRGSMNMESIARTGFEVELDVQGRASPIDTTTSTQGGGILLLKERSDGFLWRIERGDRAWNLHSCSLPEMILVVGNTGIEAPTGPLVAGVQKLAEARAEARKAIGRIGRITLEGLSALSSGDLELAGRLMEENHVLLNSLGVGHPLLDDFVEASRPYSYGAKLTGAGGGGSMICLTDRPEPVVRAIEDRGGRAFIVSTESRGVAVDEQG